MFETSDNASSGHIRLVTVAPAVPSREQVARDDRMAAQTAALLAGIASRAAVKDAVLA